MSFIIPAVTRSLGSIFARGAMASGAEAAGAGATAAETTLAEAGSAGNMGKVGRMASMNMGMSDGQGSQSNEGKTISGTEATDISGITGGGKYI